MPREHSFRLLKGVDHLLFISLIIKWLNFRLGLIVFTEKLKILFEIHKKCKNLNFKFWTSFLPNWAFWFFIFKKLYHDKFPSERVFLDHWIFRSSYKNVKNSLLTPFTLKYGFSDFITCILIEKMLIQVVFSFGCSSLDLLKNIVGTSILP